MALNPNTGNYENKTLKRVGLHYILWKADISEHLLTRLYTTERAILQRSMWTVEVFQVLGCPNRIRTEAPNDNNSF